MSPTASPLAALAAPGHWRVLDFISALHLQAAEPQAVQAWQQYLARTRADAVFILGDLFEVWVGDDVLDVPGFEAECALTLLTAAQRCSLFFMHGNRDFLLGQSAARACGMTLLDDPCTLRLGNEKIVLSHGDALCLADTDYMQFRAQVRSPSWQQAFLAKPLAERVALAQGLRQQSEARKRSQVVYADVDTHAALDMLNTAQARQIIHGHTHKPADHVLADPNVRPNSGLAVKLTDSLIRRVLSDWDATARPARLEVLRLVLDNPGGLAKTTRIPLQAAG